MAMKPKDHQAKKSEPEKKKFKTPTKPLITLFVNIKN